MRPYLPIAAEVAGFTLLVVAAVLAGLPAVLALVGLALLGGAWRFGSDDE